VLVKTEPAAALGFVSKLVDFSRCCILDEEGKALGLASGPPAPGTRRPSVEIVRGQERKRQLSVADDVHSFGEAGDHKQLTASQRLACLSPLVCLPPCPQLSCMRNRNLMPRGTVAQPL
jgi:hypothetical protein